MEHKTSFRTTFLAFLITISLLLNPCIGSSTTNIIGKEGQWQLLRDNIGVVAMHMALTHYNTILIFDQTRTGPSAYLLTRRSQGGECHPNRANDLRDSTCFAHSLEYHIASNTIRPLKIQSDPFCSSGTFLSNGTLLQTGGYANGYRKIRYYQPCGDGNCDWKLSKAKLANDRWYASNQLLPGENERVIVVGGKKVFTYEFVPRRSSKHPSYALPFLRHTYNSSEGGNNLYPFLHLSSDGNLFIFANRDSILFNYRLGRVVKTYPRMPGGGSRSYPSSGSSVILPLDHRDGFQKVEVMVCGGAAEGAYTAARNGQFLEALRTCGRMVITGHDHKWEMEEMPHPRLLMDMVILPTGHIILVNGAQRGAGGWNNADVAAHHPLLYKPKKPLGRRFLVLKETDVARMYHSSAILLPDGRILIGGSNPNERYVYHNVRYPTELKLQAFAPQYTDHRFHHIRPSNISIAKTSGIHHMIRPNNDSLVQNNNNNRVHHSNKGNNNPHRSNHPIHQTLPQPHHTTPPPQPKPQPHHTAPQPHHTTPQPQTKPQPHHTTPQPQTKPQPHHTMPQPQPKPQPHHTTPRVVTKPQPHHTEAPTPLTTNNNSNDPIDIKYGKEFQVTFRLRSKLVKRDVEFNAYAPPFTTHSVSMNQRLLKLRSTKVSEDGGWVTAVVEAPPSSNVAPSGYYMLFLVNGGIPSTAQWIRFVH